MPSIDAEKLTLVGVLLLALIGGWRKWWVYGWVYEDLKKDKAVSDEEAKRWREQSFRQAGTLDRVVEKVTK
jgi:hypothetical protein